MKKITTLMIVLAGSLYCQAQELASWTAAPSNPWNQTWAPTTTASNVTVSNFTRGPQTNASGSSASGGWGGSGGWSTAPEDGNLNGCFYFTIKATSGYRVSLSGIPVIATRRSGQGPTGATILYSINGGASYTTIGTISTTSSSGAGSNSSNSTIGDLSAIGDLQNVPATTSITIKIVPSSGNNWYIMATGGGFVLNGAATPMPLPVTLRAFSARYADGKALLSWETAMEENVAHFEIERSSDALSFTQAGLVKAANIPAGNLYHYAEAGEAGRQYYRLKTVDRDGRYSYSKVIPLVLPEPGAGIVLQQNPAGLQLSLSLKGKAGYRICDLKGTVLRSGNLESGPDNKATISLETLSPGLYLLRLQTATGTTSLKFIKE